MACRPSQAGGGRPRRGALALGCIAAVIGIVGCTKVTDGTAAPDTSGGSGLPVVGVGIGVGVGRRRPASGSPSGKQSLTTKAVHTSCDTLATTSKDAIDKVNAFVAAFNAGRSTGPTEGPAIDALNNSATAVANSFSDALSPQMRDAFNAYSDAARGGGQRHRHPRGDRRVQPAGRSTQRHQDEGGETVHGGSTEVGSIGPRAALCDDNARSHGGGWLRRFHGGRGG